MTLREKFLRYTPYEFEDEYALKCEQIAEDFAIGFYDYCETISGRLNDREITIYEAMEIYKKEKGL